MLNIIIEKINDLAVVPTKAHMSDIGHDCVATSIEHLGDGLYKYGLGFKTQIVKDKVFDSFSRYFDVAIELCPRSSIYKTGMELTNSIGQVDLDYRGEYSVVMRHIDPSKPKYDIGDRVCQLKVVISPKITSFYIGKVDTTQRGAGGFGSTGQK